MRSPVVAPSLPGYGLSFTPGQPRFGVEAIADCFAELMTGCSAIRASPRRAATGARSSPRRLGAHAERVIGIHLNLLPMRRDPAMLADPTPEERRYLDELAAWLKEETGYQWIQGTRPQTLAFGLTDSPAGLAAWIVEKFRAWTDCGGDLESVLTKDQLLANISLYWFTGAIGSSFWPYYARMHGPWPIPEGATVDVPTGYAEFPREILRPPRSLAERTYTDIRRWSVMPRAAISRRWSSPTRWRTRCARSSGRCAPRAGRRPGGGGGGPGAAHNTAGPGGARGGGGGGRPQVSSGGGRGAADPRGGA